MNCSDCGKGVSENDESGYLSDGSVYCEGCFDAIINESKRELNGMYKDLKYRMEIVEDIARMFDVDTNIDVYIKSAIVEIDRIAKVL